MRTLTALGLMFTVVAAAHARRAYKEASVNLTRVRWTDANRWDR